jgi:levansucrase
VNLFNSEFNLKTDPRNGPASPPLCSHWTAAQLALVSVQKRPETPLISAIQAQPVVAGLTVWDVWPVQLDDGRVADIGGGSLWVALSAPRRDDPNLRHDEARMRLMLRTGDDWSDCGDLLPDGLAPGSREWSGSTRLNPVTGEVTLWFTAAGRRGAVTLDFEQRLFHAVGRLDLSGKLPRIAGWAGLTESVANDGNHYADLATRQGVAGRIKGFRDPYWFRDPADGQGYILFTGSKSAAASRSDYDGVIGIAASRDDGTFELLPPLVDADGLANELERPHVIVHEGLYYLFWSTQSQVFSPDVAAGPTGLYGMVAPSLFGPYVPLNGSGLVLANPAAEPRQAYAWQVLPSLEVVSFVDYWGLDGRAIDANPALKASQFGGTIAPMVTLALAEATTHIVADGA